MRLTRISSVSVFAVCLTAGMFSAAFADVTVSKDPGDGADFNTIGAALAAAAVGETVRILDDAVYAEANTQINSRNLVAENGAIIDGRVTVQGTGSVTIAGVRIEPSSAVNNSAILVQGASTLTIEDVIVDGTSRGGSFANDGIRLNDAATVTVTNTTIRNIGQSGFLTRNNAGGFSLTATDLTITDVADEGFRLNVAGSINGTNVSISGAAGNGGIDINAGPTTLNLTGGRIFLNEDFGIFSRAVGIITLNGVTIEANGIDGIRLNQPGCQLTVTDSTIQNNSRHAVSVNQAADLNFDECTITGNTEDGIQISGSASGSSLTVSGTLISENGSNGAIGIRVNGQSAVTISSTSIINNNGVGISVGQSGDGTTMTITDAIISGNGDHGFRINRGGTYTFTNIAVEDNGAMGILRDFEDVGSSLDTSMSISNATIRNNAVHGILAKAVDNNIHLTVDQCLIEGNLFRGLSTEDTPPSTGRVLLEARRNIIRDGSALEVPAAFLWATSPGSIFENNLVDQGLNGINLNRSAIDIQHNTVVSDSSFTATLVFVNDVADGESVNIVNNILSYGEVGIVVDNIEGTVNVTHNLINVTDAAIDAALGPPDASNIIGANPAFIAPSNEVGEGDYVIHGWSPAVDAGTDLGVTEDLLGNIRPLDAGPDMGAYEVPLVEQAGARDWIMMF